MLITRYQPCKVRKSAYSLFSFITAQILIRLPSNNWLYLVYLFLNQSISTHIIHKLSGTCRAVVKIAVQDNIV